MMVTNKLNMSIFARVCDSFSKKQEVTFQLDDLERNGWVYPITL